MTNLLINRVNYLLSGEIPDMYLSKKDIALFRMKSLHFKKKFSNRFYQNDFAEWIKDIKDENYIYYSFFPLKSDDVFILKSDNYLFNYFKAKYIREQLISFFKASQFLIEPFPKGNDLSVYQKAGIFNNEWSIYRRYDFLVRSNRNEIGFNIGSENTLISDNSHQINKGDRIRFIDINDDFIKPLAGRTDVISARIIADRQKRSELGISTEPKKFNYNFLYKQLTTFYNDELLKISNDQFKIEAGGLKNVDQIDLNSVNLNENLMLFGKEKTDINAVTGMRDYGIYKPSPKAQEVKFVFVYENSKDANQLYLHLKNGLKHYPGLWSYVGIPIRLADQKLQYASAEDLKSKIDQFLTENFPNNSYGDYFAIVIQPFSNSEREDTNDDEPELYYEIKNKFLSKGIPTQFIQDKNIHSGSFHYFLPNISIGILAKLGGVPWRLKSKKTDELIIGFNRKIVGENRYVGSAVFFSNEGELGGTYGFPEANSEQNLILSLKTSIENYIKSRQNPPQRLVIHYYKPQSGSEQKSIENLIQNDLRLNIPFAIVEINDSKSQMDICFDSDFNMGMPESGTYVKVGFNEYLLFNNTRYQKNPVRSVAEELPIKVAIHFADTGGFSHKELISQIYEFSRLYWKGLKQRSQPATTIYAKLIADFAAHSNGTLPDNDTVHNSPWFL